MFVMVKSLAWKDIPWLYCIGLALLLLSWLGEKKFEQEFMHERGELERLQRQTWSNHTNAQLWYGHILVLDSQTPKNSQATAFASLRYMEFMLNALESGVAWGSANMAERKKFAELRQSALEPAKAAFRERQYEKVISRASHLSTVEIESAGRLAWPNGRYFGETEAQRNFWGWLFRVSCVIGASLIGFAFVRDRSRAKTRGRGSMFLSE